MIVEELAQRRLSADMNQGMLLSHNFVLRKCPGKEWGDKYGGFSWCPACKGWAWGLSGICVVKYRAKFAEYVQNAKEDMATEVTDLSSERLASQRTSPTEQRYGGKE